MVAEGGGGLRSVIPHSNREHLNILELLGISNFGNTTTGEMPGSSKIVVSTIILMIWITGMISNVVIWIRACSPRCQGLFGQRALSVYVVHKSIADIMLLLSCPFHISALFHPSGWVFGPGGCRFIASVDMLAILLSANSLFSLGIERYRSMVRASTSVSNRLKRLRKSYLHLAAIWVYCATLASPVMAVSTSYADLNGRIVCGYIWPQGGQNYYQMFFSVQFFLNFILIFGTLLYMWYHAWEFARIKLDVNSFSTRRRDMRKHRAVIFLCVSHFVCWFPYWIWQFLRTTGRSPYEIIFGNHIPGGSSAPELAVTTLMYIPSSISLFVFMACIDEWRNGCHVRESSMSNGIATRDRNAYNVEIGLQSVSERQHRSNDTVFSVSYHVKHDDDHKRLERTDELVDDNDSGQGSSEAAPRGTDDILLHYQNSGFLEDENLSDDGEHLQNESKILHKNNESFRNDSDNLQNQDCENLHEACAISDNENEMLQGNDEILNNDDERFGDNGVRTKDNDERRNENGDIIDSGTISNTEMFNIKGEPTVEEGAARVKEQSNNSGDMATEEDDYVHTVERFHERNGEDLYDVENVIVSAHESDVDTSRGTDTACDNGPVIDAGFEGERLHC